MELSEEVKAMIEKKYHLSIDVNGNVIMYAFETLLSDPELLAKAGYVKKEEWISVKDSRKPLTEDDILVSDGIFVNMGYAIGSNFYINNEQATVQDEAKITHWQPLPSPPQNK